MALRLLWNQLFEVKTLSFCHYVCNVVMVITIHNVNKYVNHLYHSQMPYDNENNTRPPDKSA